MIRAPHHDVVGIQDNPALPLHVFLSSLTRHRSNVNTLQHIKQEKCMAVFDCRHRLSIVCVGNTLPHVAWSSCDDVTNNSHCATDCRGSYTYRYFVGKVQDDCLHCFVFLKLVCMQEYLPTNVHLSPHQNFPQGECQTVYNFPSFITPCTFNPFSANSLFSAHPPH